MTTTESELRQLRLGSRLMYHGVKWQVTDFSTYTDPHGYETEEWLLSSVLGKEYYLMREVDPSHPETPVHWYLAEEVQNFKIYEPGSTTEVGVTLAQDIQSHRTPYPSLQFYNRVYHFESQTEGTYESDDSNRNRITWDYWDDTHLWNLALEAWSHHKLAVYSTRAVQPADFTSLQLENAVMASSRSAPDLNTGFRRNARQEARNIQRVLAWFVTIVGFFLMLTGI